MSSTRIEIILGCMYSGKSTELIRRCTRYKAIGKNILLVNHSLDTRTGDSVMTHRKETLDAVKTNKLISLIETDEFKNCDIVGIDENAFNYVEGSDPDLELYDKNLFFDSLELSPDGEKMAFLSESNDFTQGILVVDVDEYFSNNRSFEKSTIAKAAMENKPDTDLGVRAMFICNFLWANKICDIQFSYIKS